MFQGLCIAPSLLAIPQKKPDVIWVTMILHAGKAGIVHRRKSFIVHCLLQTPEVYTRKMGSFVLGDNVFSNSTVKEFPFC